MQSWKCVKQQFTACLQRLKFVNSLQVRVMVLNLATPTQAFSLIIIYFNVSAILRRNSIDVRQSINRQSYSICKMKRYIQLLQVHIVISTHMAGLPEKL